MFFELAGRNGFDHLREAHPIGFNFLEGCEEGFLVDRKGVPGLGHCRPMRRILHGIREHEKARFRLWLFLVLCRGVEGPRDPGCQAGCPHPEEQETARLTAGWTGSVDPPRCCIRRVIHPDRCGGAGFEIVVI